MTNVSLDIAQLLNDNGLGSIGFDLFALEFNPTVDAQILVNDTGGQSSDLKEVYEKPTFQILVRGARGEDQIVTHNLARSIYEFLIDQPSQTIGITDYLQYEPISSLSNIGRDENDRPIWTMNFYTFRNSL